MGAARLAAAGSAAPHAACAAADDGRRRALVPADERDRRPLAVRLHDPHSRAAHRRKVDPLRPAAAARAWLVGESPSTATPDATHSKTRSVTTWRSSTRSAASRATTSKASSSRRRAAARPTARSRGACATRSSSPTTPAIRLAEAARRTAADWNGILALRAATTGSGVNELLGQVMAYSLLRSMASPWPFPARLPRAADRT